LRRQAFVLVNLTVLGDKGSKGR